MTRLGTGAVAGLLLGVAAAAAMGAESTNAAPDFKEVYDLVAEHVPGLNQPELNRIAVQALLSALTPKVSLVKDTNEANLGATNQAVSRTSLFDGGIAYLRVQKVNENLAPEFQQGYRKLSSGTNHINGIVLDLRYARGDDYGAAVSAAGLFLKKEKPLLDWGNGMARSKDNPEALSVPVAALVNRETAGAAEALAAILKETGVGLVLGGRTAGQAMLAKEYPLKDGERLRIATGPIRLGDGAALSPEGLAPDIVVEVSPREEQAYYADPFRELPKTNAIASVLTGPSGPALTNRSRRFRFNEAELVRERKEGLPADADFDGQSDPDKPAVRDPALARALDVLKGLAVFRQSRS